MKFLRLETEKSREETLEMLRDNRAVNDGVRFDGPERPTLRIREHGGLLRMRCQMIGGESRDNGFVEGTFFLGRLREKNGKTRLSGIVLTEPVYHVLLFGLLVFFILTCLKNAGFAVAPPLILAFSIYMMRKEYRKQSILCRYVRRAFRNLGE